MKTYLIKNQFAASLMGLPGVYVHPYSYEHKSVEVFDVQDNLGFCKGIVTLPKSSNTRLVHQFLKQLQQNNARPEGIESLRKYLHCAQKKDKNGVINADIKDALKDILFGLLLIMGSVGGFLLTALLAGLFPVYASWISFLIIPVVALAVYGGINTLVGVIKLGVGIVSYCFRKNNTESLSGLEQTLKTNVLNADLPSYEDIQKNYYQPTAISYENEVPPPTYQQATELLSTRAATSPVYVQMAMPGATANFFQAGQSPSNPTEVSDNPLARCRNF